MKTVLQDMRMWHTTLRSGYQRALSPDENPIQTDGMTFL